VRHFELAPPHAEAGHRLRERATVGKYRIEILQSGFRDSGLSNDDPPVLFKRVSIKHGGADDALDDLAIDDGAYHLALRLP
jgi:hypothetical protein